MRCRRGKLFCPAARATVTVLDRGLVLQLTWSHVSKGVRNGITAVLAQPLAAFDRDPDRDRAQRARPDARGKLAAAAIDLRARADDRESILTRSL